MGRPDDLLAVYRRLSEIHDDLSDLRNSASSQVRDRLTSAAGEIAAAQRGVQSLIGQAMTEPGA